MEKREPYSRLNETTTTNKVICLQSMDRAIQMLDHNLVEVQGYKRAVVYRKLFAPYFCKSYKLFWELIYKRSLVRGYDREIVDNWWLFGMELAAELLTDNDKGIEEMQYRNFGTLKIYEDSVKIALYELYNTVKNNGKDSALLYREFAKMYYPLTYTLKVISSLCNGHAPKPKVKEYDKAVTGKWVSLGLRVLAKVKENHGTPERITERNEKLKRYLEDEGLLKRPSSERLLKEFLLKQ